MICRILCFVNFLWRVPDVQSLLVQPVSTAPTFTTTTTHFPDSLIVDGAFLLAAMHSETSIPTKDFEVDQVARILDANTVKLRKNGIVSLAGARLPAVGVNFQLPECSEYSPSYKLRSLVPPGTNILVKIFVSGSSKPQAILLRKEDSLVVNQELIRTGFAKTRPNSEFEKYLDFEKLQQLQDEAKRLGLGIFKRCDDRPEAETFVAEFEPLEFDVETQWGDDGGKLVLKPKEKTQGVPDNPGDKKGCSDFEVYEDALRWYERYYPFYGDVAKLDRNADGVPCPGLPHTNNQNKYRMKVPKPSQ